MEFYWYILNGLISAGLYAVIGYSKSYTYKSEMDIDKLIKTFISGIFAGIILLLLGIPIDYNSTMDILSILSGNIFFIYLLNKGISIIWRLMRRCNPAQRIPS